MARAWRTLAKIPTKEGALELRHRGADEFLIVIAGRVLMTSGARRSEIALATLACAELRQRPMPAVLIGGLGMGYTLREALDALPPRARVTVAELTAEVVEWCRGPLAPLTAAAVLDRRVKIELGDVAQVIAGAKASSYDAIILDLYEGPHAATQRKDDPFYGAAALARAYDALARRGILAVWSEEADAAFEARLRSAGFAVSVHRQGGGGRRHVIYLATRR